MRRFVALVAGCAIGAWAWACGSDRPPVGESSSTGTPPDSGAPVVRTDGGDAGVGEVDASSGPLCLEDGDASFPPGAFDGGMCTCGYHYTDRITIDVSCGTILCTESKKEVAICHFDGGLTVVAGAWTDSGTCPVVDGGLPPCNADAGKR